MKAIQRCLLSLIAVVIELYWHRCSWWGCCRAEKNVDGLYMCVPAESIVEAALCKSLLKPLREPIYQSLEKLHTNDGSLKQLARNQVGTSGAALVTA